MCQDVWGYEWPYQTGIRNFGYIMIYSFIFWGQAKIFLLCQAVLTGRGFLEETNLKSFELDRPASSLENLNECHLRYTKNSTPHSLDTIETLHSLGEQQPQQQQKQINEKTNSKILWKGWHSHPSSSPFLFFAQGLEGALTTLKGQVATVEHNLQERVSRVGWAAFFFSLSSFSSDWLISNQQIRSQ